VEEEVVQVGVGLKGTQRISVRSKRRSGRKRRERKESEGKCKEREEKSKQN
jgi:hypothetical protein